jgi:ferrochelatase
VVTQAIDDLLLLPLYPQFSTTTTGSSFADMEGALKSAGYTGALRRICCYPTEGGFIAAMAEGMRRALAEVRPFGPVRILLSAHGLPERIVKAGDPYQWQVEQTAAALIAAIAEPGLDWVVCYQSRVGPLKWIGPETKAEIESAAVARRPLIVVPIAFVSEHSETLVELDMEYRALAAGGPAYVRTQTVRAVGPFIEGLAGLCRGAFAAPAQGGFCNARVCPAGLKGCPNR